MAGVLKISEAASIGLHTMVYLAAADDNRGSVREIAETLGVSEAHLSKVMQRLGREGLVKSSRGPRGGFALSRKPNEITLLEVFEAIEGPMVSTSCLLGDPICGCNCIFGGLLRKVERDVREYFSGRKLSELTSAFRREKQ